MSGKRIGAAAFALAGGLLLASCGSVSNFVSDSWPHFAGGEPNGVPPRPGQPGYAEFIAHGQSSETSNSAPGNGQDVAPGATASVGGQGSVSDPAQAPTGAKPPTVAQPAAGAGQPQRSGAAPTGAADSNVGQGGLY